MKLRIKKWEVAFRKRTDNLFDNNKDFKRIKYDYTRFIADPFLFKKNGEIFLFVEYFPYKLGRGIIAYAKYDEAESEFGEFKEVIKEDYHLSYPLVFEYKNEVYMMPEANESDSLYVYKAQSFPDKWEKHEVLLNDIKLVDTTPFMYNGVPYAITKVNDTPEAPMMLLKLDLENWKVLGSKMITDDVSVSRPGGNAFEYNKKYYISTQDCKDDYGKALNLLSFTIDDDLGFEYKLEKKILPGNICIRGIKNIAGIHTYNFTDSLEVIDFKYPKFALYRLWCRLTNFLGLD